MGVFRLPKNQQMVQGFPVNRSYTKQQSDDKYVDSIVAGSNITVDNTDPRNPVVSSTGGGGTPGGSDTQVQFNDGGTFGGDAGLTYNKTTDTLLVGVGAGIVKTHAVRSDASDGLILEANNGTDVGILGTGNTTNATWYGSHNFNGRVESSRNSLGTSTTDAFLAENTTSATSGNQQVSPAITRIGQGWKTESGGVSQSVAVRDFVLPVQSSASPGFIHKYQYSINSGTWTDAFWYDQTPGGAGFSVYTSNAQSNGVPGTTRIMSLNNTGLNTWIDNNFSGTRKSSWGADSSGVMYADATGSNGLVVRIGGIAYHYLSNLGLLTTGYGAFSYGVNAGSTNANTSTLQSSGGTGLQPKRVTVNTTLDNTATRWIADATDNSYCNGTTTYSCSHWTNQTDCELRNSHGGCTWNAGNPCSAFDNEFNMGTCLATSPCSATTASCVGPTDETTCLAQDDTYGGSCVFNPESTGDCSVFNGSESTCSGTTGCSVSSSNSCPSQFDEGSCTGAGCSWNGSSCDGDNSACTGTYVISPASCSGTYYTGACTGTYGASCSGTASCANIVGSSNCSGEAGCSFVNRIELYLPDLTTCPSMDYWIINKTPGGDDVIIYPYSGQTVNDTTSLTLANYKDGVHIGAYNDVRSCTTLSEGGCTPSGCTPNYVNCSWDYGLSVCTGGGSCSSYFDDTSCNAATYYSSCTGTYVVSRNWDVWSRT